MRARWRALVRACVTLFLYDVFISYARRDGRRYARALHRHLERSGIVCFLDRNDVLAGSSLNPTLVKALKKSRLLLVVATSGAGQSRHVQLEIQTFVATGRPVVPVDFAGSYARGEWPLLKPLDLVWLDELSSALEGRPSAEVLQGVRQHLKSAGSRVFAQRLLVFVAVILAALGGAAWWSAQQASEQARQKESEQLSSRAALAFDVDQNPLRALAYGVVAVSRHASLEVGQMLSRVLPFARRPLNARKIARLASRVSYSARGRYLLGVGRLDTPHDVLTVVEVSTMKEVWRAERSAVIAAVMSPDERLVAWSDAGPCLPIVRVEGGGQVACLPQANVSRAEFSTDGTALMTTGRSTGGAQPATDSVVVWDTASWRPRAELAFPAGVTSAALGPDGAHVAVGLKATQLGAPIACLWHVREADCRPLVSLEHTMRSGRLWESATVQFSDNGELLLVAEPTRLIVLETASGQERQRLADSTGFGRVEFDPSGNALMAANALGLVTLYPTRLSPLSPTIAQLPHASRVVAARFTPDGHSILTAAEDGIVRVWDAGIAGDEFNDFTQSTRLSGIATHGANLTSFIRSRAQSIADLSAAPDGQSFATAGSDGWIRVWSTGPEPEVDWGRHGQGVTAVSATAKGDLLVTAGEFSGRVWTVNPLKVKSRLRRHANDLTGAAVSRDGQVIVTAGSDGTVFVFNGGNQEFLGEIVHEPGAERLVRAALAADGSSVVTTSSDRVVKLWRSRDRGLISHRQFDVGIDAFALSPAGDAIAIAGDGAITVWDISDDWRQRVSIPVDSTPRALQLNETWLVAGSEDGSVRIWNATTGRQRWAAAHAGVVAAVNISVDEQWIASASHDRTVRIWDTSTGSELARLVFPFRVDAVTFIHDASRIVAGGENYVQVSPWRVEELRNVACRYVAGIPAESWPRLVGDVESVVCNGEDRRRGKGDDGGS